MYLKFAEKNVDILVQIVNAKFENESGNDNRYTWYKIWGNFFLQKMISTACISMLQHPLLSGILTIFLV